MRKKRKKPTYAQDITCAFCGKAAKKKANGQRFCTDKCRYANYTVKNIEKVCEVCGTTYFTHKSKAKRKRTCGTFCGDVLSSVERQKYTDEEIIHLALLNAGYGVYRFENMLTGGSGGERLIWVRELCKEETGLDIYQILNDSTKLIEMPRDEWLAKGKPSRVKGTGTPGTALRINQKEALVRYENEKKYGRDLYAPRTRLRVLVYPEFDWGPYGPR